MKNLAKSGFGKKEVNHALYGKRAYASKNPNLSPITENLSSLSCSPTPQHPHTSRHTAKGDSSLLEDVINSDPITGVVMAAALWQSRLCPAAGGVSPEDTIPTAEPSVGPSEAPVGFTTGCFGTGRAARAGRRWSGPTNTFRTKEQKEPSVIRGGRGKGRKVSVPVDCLSEEQVENTDQDPTETSQAEVSESSPAKHTVPGDRESEPNAQCTSDPVNTDQCTCTLPDAGRSGGSPVRADTTCCPPTHEVSATVASLDQEAVSHVEQRSNKGKQRGEARGPGRSRGRRSSIYASSVVEEREEAQAPQSIGPEAVEESGQDVENDIHRSEMEQGSITEQASFRDSLLPPWAQEEFSIDDVLRPLPSRGRRSVRRSLRNQSQSSTLEARGSGLAWLPQTSPDSIRAIRRKTRGRRSSIQALLPPPLE
ncbi:uncharacterized protein [Oncorhynchus clarkii lewisi]|uniref:uncharacterized protein n=1 Tax=Oncorhynchus clarkii lewisi TaxID=490388 RepID=UPI0039B9486C